MGVIIFFFVDFTKTFDSIPHSHLWYKLIKSGMHRRMLQVIRSMYTSLKLCVRTPEGLTKYFACEMGTRQGCILSPALFAFYIGELVDMLRCLTLLYADDSSDTVGRLQKIINVLFTYCKLWHLLVNMIKTKLVVFRRITTNELCSRANKALHNLYKYTYRFWRLPINVSLTLFDKMVLPILLHGSDIWGHSDCEAVERVHLKFCKPLLGVGSTTSDVAVLGELGRSPLAINYKMRCIKYRLKLLKLPEQRMPKACYKILKKNRWKWEENMGKWCETFITDVRISFCLDAARGGRWISFSRGILFKVNKLLLGKMDTR